MAMIRTPQNDFSMISGVAYEPIIITYNKSYNF